MSNKEHGSVVHVQDSFQGFMVSSENIEQTWDAYAQNVNGLGIFTYLENDNAWLTLIMLIKIL